MREDKSLPMEVTEMRHKMHDELALVGRYATKSLALALVLALHADAVPLWRAFPLTTIWMILDGSLVPPTK